MSSSVTGPGQQTTIEDLQARIHTLESNLAAVQVDRDRKVRAAQLHEESALRAAYAAGVASEDIAAQAEFDRAQRQLVDKQYDHTANALGVVAAVAGLARRLGHAEAGARIDAGVVVVALDKILSGVKAPTVELPPPATGSVASVQGGLFEAAS